MHANQQLIYFLPNQVNFSNQAQLRFDSSDINNFLKKYPLFKSLETDIRKFYSGRNFTYAWYDNNGMIKQADNLYNHVIKPGRDDNEITRIAIDKYH